MPGPEHRPAHACGRIAFLLKVFPKVSETFILGEILGLEALGLPLSIYSLNRPAEQVTHSGLAASRTPIHYVSRFTAGAMLRVLRAHLFLLCTHPRRYVHALAYAWHSGEPEWWLNFVLAVTLTEALKRDGVTHLHAHYASHPAAVAELVEQIGGISFSISAHAKDIYLSSLESLRRKLSQARFTVTCTKYNRAYLADHVGNDKAIHHMYHGIDIDRLRPLATKLPANGPESPPVVLGVGRLREKKGFDILLRACAVLRAQGVPFRCEIVGYGPESQQLEALVAELRLAGSVAFLGKLGHDQVIARYHQARLFALPCRLAADGDRDGIPNALLEAMATELPVIATPVSGIPEVIDHGFNGILVPPDDAEALARAMRSLLEQPECAQKLGKAARATVATLFSAGRNLRLLSDLLIAATRRPSPVRQSDTRAPSVPTTEPYHT